MHIAIESLSCDAIIGVYPHERLAAQRVLMDIAFDYQFADGKYIDYGPLITMITSTLEEQQFFLLEDALEYIAAMLKAEYTDIQNLSLTICKPAIFQNAMVKVSWKDRE